MSTNNMKNYFKERDKLGIKYRDFLGNEIKKAYNTSDPRITVLLDALLCYIDSTNNEFFYRTQLLIDTDDNHKKLWMQLMLL
jgi:hypothetical protein